MSDVTKALRDQVYSTLATLGTPVEAARGAGDVRDDGVTEFTIGWTVSGSAANGVLASVRDFDDQIELSLLQRDEGEATNLLHISLLLDDDLARLNVMSSTRMEANFDAEVSPDDRHRLTDALRFFAEGLAG